MTDHELLLAVSNAVQSQIEPLKHDIRDVKLLLENDVLPRLNTIEVRMKSQCKVCSR